MTDAGAKLTELDNMAREIQTRIDAGVNIPVTIRDAFSCQIEELACMMIREGLGENEVDNVLFPYSAIWFTTTAAGLFDSKLSNEVRTAITKASACRPEIADANGKSIQLGPVLITFTASSKAGRFATRAACLRVFQLLKRDIA